MVVDRDYVRVVLFLAGSGTVEVVRGERFCGGEGPNPIQQPAGAVRAETAAIQAPVRGRPTATRSFLFR